MRKAISIFFALVGSMTSVARVSACVCGEYGTPPCAAYSRADAVFVGTVLSVNKEKPSENSWPMVRIEFGIDEAFKNISGKTVQVWASTDTDCSSKYEIGDRLFVYTHKDSTTKRWNIWDCDRTTSLDSADEDLSYARQAIKGLSKQGVSGMLRLNGYEVMPGMKVVVEKDQKKYTGKTDAQGRFNIELPASGNYTIRASVPFSAGALSRRSSVEEKTTEAESVFSYSVDLPKGECDYRELEVYTVDLKATAQISGKVVDQDGKACPSVMVYLYPGTPDQDFLRGGGESKQTDAEGRYSFEGLREGRFWLGVNLGRLPEVDSPYPTTYFPGVPDLATAAPIVLEQGQQLKLREFHLPPKLVEREVTGIMLWPDGTRVTRLSGDGPSTMGPSLSITDPHRLWYPLTSRRLDGTFTEITNKDGGFSFVGFEGYTYVIHVHAWDSQNRLLHTNVKYTIARENKPLTLVLSKPGYGEGEDAKAELGDPKQ